MKFKFILFLFIPVLIGSGACHIRKSKGTKQDISKDTPIPAGDRQKQDTSTHSPEAKFTPRSLAVPNARPKPVPDPKAPVPPM